MFCCLASVIRKLVTSVEPGENQPITMATGFNLCPAGSASFHQSPSAWIRPIRAGLTYEGSRWCRTHLSSRLQRRRSHRRLREAIRLANKARTRLGCTLPRHLCTVICIEADLKGVAAAWQPGGNGAHDRKQGRWNTVRQSEACGRGEQSGSCTHPPPTPTAAAAPSSGRLLCYKHEEP